MKLMSSITRKLLVCGVTVTAFAMTASVMAQAPQVGKITVRAVHGTAQVQLTAGAAWTPLRVNTMLKPGAVIKTAAESYVDVMLGQMLSIVRVTANTEVGMDKFNVTKTDDDVIMDTLLDLKAGTLLGNVKKLAATSKYDVKTPVNVCGIRGTKFKVDGNGNVVVYSGKVQVSITINGVTNTYTIDASKGAKMFNFQNAATYADPSNAGTPFSGPTPQGIQEITAPVTVQNGNSQNNQPTIVISPVQ
ncbi:MAG: FecR domain-containing protein [Verrucomicrobiota bacterium]